MARRRARRTDGIAFLEFPAVTVVLTEAGVLATVRSWPGGSGRAVTTTPRVADKYPHELSGALQLENLAHKLREDLMTYLQVEELNTPQPTPGLPL